MAGQKHLHELLKEDQEPFRLKRYLADRRCLLKTCDPPPIPKAKPISLQLKRRKPVVETIAKRSLCKQACFFAFHDYPDVPKSPLPGFLSPAKSPCRTNNGSVLLHIPARTATLLLEAAMRIQKQQSSSHSKSKAHIKNVGFGLFSSILKKLKERNKSKKCEILRPRDIEIPRGSGMRIEEHMDEAKSADEVGIFSCSCNNNRLSSAGWSESNEERSLDTETSTSCSRSDDSEDLDYAARRNGAFINRCENRFRSSPFRFSLQRSPSSGRTSPIFSSPAASPRRRNREDKENYEGNKRSEKNQLAEDEEKEQSSPVSVLDPPFDNEEEEGRESEEEEDYDVECSFAMVQRAKEQLLYKLRRFEKLAELDPVELEKRMMEELDGADEVDEDEDQNDELFSAYKSCSVDSFVTELLSKSELLSRRKVPADMKRLVSDLISEENREMKSREIVLVSVCNKLDSWKEVESNTIDMMVELDLRSELHHWKKWQDEREETALEIELAIFGVLVEELTKEMD